MPRDGYCTTLLAAFQWEEEARVGLDCFSGDRRVHPQGADVITRVRRPWPVLSELLEGESGYLEWAIRHLDQGGAVLVVTVPEGEAWYALKVLVRRALSPWVIELPARRQGSPLPSVAPVSAL